PRRDDLPQEGGALPREQGEPEPGKGPKRRREDEEPRQQPTPTARRERSLPAHTGQERERRCGEQEELHRIAQPAELEQRPHQGIPAAEREQQPEPEGNQGEALRLSAGGRGGDRPA